LLRSGGADQRICSIVVVFERRTAQRRGVGAQHARPQAERRERCQLHALAGGPTAALGPSLTGEGQPLAQLQGDFDRRRDACMLMIAAAVRTSADSAKAERGVVDAVEKYAREPLPEPDLEQAKRQVEAGMVYGAQGARGRAQALVGAQMLSGDWQAWQRRVVRVRELTAADVQRAARATLTASHRSIVWVKPEKTEGAKR